MSVATYPRAEEKRLTSLWSSVLDITCDSRGLHEIPGIAMSANPKDRQLHRCEIRKQRFFHYQGGSWLFAF